MIQDFIEEIVFEEDFSPFKKGDKIEFKGEKEIQGLLEFYLKSKGEKNPHENAKRFKINCLLGSNGGGKSRLIEWIIGKEDILNNTTERKNKYWDFYDLGFWNHKTQSYYFDNTNNSLNICDTKNELLKGSSEFLEKTLEKSENNQQGKDEKNYSEIVKIAQKSHSEEEDCFKYQENNVVREEDYLEYIGKNSKEIIKFKNILDENGKIISFTFLLDDFFKLSGNIKFSENYEILNKNKYNRFFCNTFNQIHDFSEMYSVFLNLPIDSELKILFDFQNWKKIFTGDYFDFLNYNENYNDEIDKRNIKEEIDYDSVLYFFEVINDIYEGKNNILRNFGIHKKESQKIWLYLSELFLTTINHFDLYMSIDDDFTKHMLKGYKKALGGTKNDFSEKGLYAYKNYSDYKKSLLLLKNYLHINLDLLQKDKFNKFLLKDKNNRLKTKSYLENIMNNLDSLLKNLKNIEDNIGEISRKGYIEHYEQKYSFKNIRGEEVSYFNFIDKIQKSKYSSQSKYLLVNLLFGYSDINYYTEVDNNTAYQDYVSKEEVKQNKNIIRDLSYYFFDGPIEFSSGIELEKFSYYGNNKLEENQINFIDNKFINSDLCFGTKYFSNLSAGEKTILTRFTNIYKKILEEYIDGEKSYIILIDEPDLHLHLDWQRKYIQKLIDVFSTLPEDINIHFIIATHSPFIISDLPGECIIKLQGDGKGNTEISYMNETEKTFGANYIDLIQNGFFFENKNLMGSFAENIIDGLADEERKRVFNGEQFDNTIKENIGDNFLKQNLIYFHRKNEKN